MHTFDESKCGCSYGYYDKYLAPEMQVTYRYNDKNINTFDKSKCGCSYRYSDKYLALESQYSYRYIDKNIHTFINYKVWTFLSI